ncbi:MAG TPA: cytochrome P460 family protein [Kofleriaceae bacterium]|nr:cytochrome P460 family protein [Kofleriaceae bacterium]
MKGALAFVAFAACIGNGVSDRIDKSEYETWKKIATHGVLPAHGGPDNPSYRIIYANPEATTFEGAGHYPEGSILVKEVYDLDTSSGSPAPGKLQYVAVMRRLDGPQPQGLSDEGGWLFTEASTPGGAETHYAYCWDSCHVASPYHGAWLDYSK